MDGVRDIRPSPSQLRSDKPSTAAQPLIVSLHGVTGSEDIEKRGIFSFRHDGFSYTVVCIRDEDSLLSPREGEIVRLIASGHPNKRIAAVLEISEWTVATHLRRVFQKLHVTSRAAMIAKINLGERGFG